MKLIKLIDLIDCMDNYSNEIKEIEINLNILEKREGEEYSIFFDGHPPFKKVYIPEELHTMIKGILIRKKEWLKTQIKNLKLKIREFIENDEYLI